MNIAIRPARAQDAAAVASLVTALTREICDVCGDKTHFDHNEELTAELCARWIEQGLYAVLLAYDDGQPVGVVTIAESHALYAEGKIGIIQECYVAPPARGKEVGSALLEAALGMAPQRGWICMELCTPPLPEFAQAISFYEKHRFRPVGGRKMRVRCAA